MAQLVTLIPGDGIGPEVTDAARRVIDASGVEIEWLVRPAGAEHFERHGTPLPEETVAALRRSRIALKGPIGTPIGGGYRSVNVQLRQMFDLYANFRPVRSTAGVASRYENVDLIIVRENTEGLYSGIEHVVVPGVVESLRVVTARGSERIVRFAFELARARGRKSVTAVHKANILKLSDGLFLDIARRIAREFPEIEYRESIVDATAMKLVLDPAQFDVLVMENLFGDILSDLASGLAGGLGLAPSANFGADAAVFEAVHGSAPDIAGKGVANPTALILSGALMLRHLGQEGAAELIEGSVRDVIAAGTVRTRDLGGSASGADYVSALLEAMRERSRGGGATWNSSPTR
ncbi:MAG: isocitrate/isopropylmalate dehydrogenase family protein [Acidobacteria bacterium]|nr:isocitrate/isopropylmalate dehydrogenase family protein [Acidobacteriota bacterium]